MATVKIIILAAVALLFGVVFGALLIVALILANEEPRKRCGNCAAFDRDLRICWWDRKPRGEYRKGCVHFDKSAEYESNSN